MGIAEVLTIIFVILKLVGVITWSWWLVLLPEIIGIGVYVLWIIILAIFAAFGFRKLKKDFPDDDFFK